MNRHHLVSSRKLARELGIFRSSVQRIFKNDLKLQTYKMQNAPMLTDEHTAKRLKFEKLATNKFPKRRYDEDSVFRREIIQH